MPARRLATSVISVIALVFTALGLTTVPANASYRTSWDCLAHYESTQRWHINTGNGHYGGLQFNKTTWRYYGGRHLSGTAWPHRATRVQQIRIAKRVAHSGWMHRSPQGGRNAWPNTWPRCH